MLLNDSGGSSSHPFTKAPYNLQHLDRMRRFCNQIFQDSLSHNLRLSVLPEMFSCCNENDDVIRDRDDALDLADYLVS